MGFILNLFRNRPKTDKDGVAINALRKRGVDMTRPLMLRHFLYFALEYEARVVAAQLVKQGFDIDLLDAPMNSGLLVVARRADAPDGDAIRVLRASLHELALSQKGEYDGWEAELPSGEGIAGATART
ncbi:MAG: ribonuclease E inhibitor RraB [Dehalococcoidia bacterium]